jgi:uncharacterized protein YjbI with pentapeptide repeats
VPGFEPIGDSQTLDGRKGLRDMTRDQQIELLKRGVDAWNDWRQNNPNVEVDLSNATFGDIKVPKIDLRSANLKGARLRWAYMREARLFHATLDKADLQIADLSRADLRQASLQKTQLAGAYLRQANLEDANLRGAHLVGVNMDHVNLRNADLTNANLRNAVLVDVDLTKAKMNGCRVYGTSVWNTDTTDAEQGGLIITRERESDITVDSLDVAQFIYLLLNSAKLRDVINTVSSKVVLILGRFTPERKDVLDSLRDALRHTKPPYVPVMFDFQRPSARDFIETVSTLAHMSRFVIADVTDPKIVLEEIPHIVRNLAIPVLPLLLGGSGEEPVTLTDLRRNHRSLLPTFIYANKNELLDSLENVIGPAEALVAEMRSI